MEKKKGGQLWSYIWRYKYMYLVGIAFLLFVDFVNLYIPQFTGELTDGLADHSLNADGIRSIILKIVICAIVLGAGRFAYRYFIIGTSRKIIRNFQDDMFRKLETLSQRYFNENKTGDIMSYFTNDLDTLQEATGWTIVSIFDAIVLTVMTLYKMMTYVNFRLTLYTMIPMLFVGIYSYFMIQIFEKSYTARQDAQAKLSDVVQESVSAERVIKAFVQEKEEIASFGKANEENRDINFKLARQRAYAWPIMELFIGIAVVVELILGGYFCLMNELTVGKFIAYNSYVGTLVWPMIAFGDSITSFTLAKAGLNRINKVFEEVPDIQNDANPDEVTDLSGEIRFDDVTFRYKESAVNALEHISCEIQAGETFAVMGRTGAGKTTLVNLITRLYDITDGKLTLDGHDIRKIPLKVLRESIAYVPQDNYLFSDTLAHNIAFGKLDATMDEITEVARRADLDDDIRDFPDKYETMMGERGVNLSGGQKQRSSIARALLKDSPILIMDDSLSAVDTDTEDKILGNLKELREGKTTILIAHRVSTVRNANHILVLDDGKPVEFGTYDELIAEDGLFARMVRKQALEKQLTEEE